MTSISRRNNFVNFKLPRLNISIKNIPRTFFSPLKILDSKSMKSLAFHSRRTDQIHECESTICQTTKLRVLPVQLQILSVNVSLSLADHRCISIDRWFSRATCNAWNSRYVSRFISRNLSEMKDRGGWQQGTAIFLGLLCQRASWPRVIPRCVTVEDRGHGCAAREKERKRERER